jgi:hypothetical protein
MDVKIRRAFYVEIEMWEEDVDSVSYALKDASTYTLQETLNYACQVSSTPLYTRVIESERN